MQRVTHNIDTPFFPISCPATSLKPHGWTNTPPSTPKRPQSVPTHVFVMVIIIMLSLGLCFATFGYEFRDYDILILGIDYLTTFIRYD